MPALPPWEGMHPLLVHLPIGVYFAAIVLAFFALLFRKRAGTWMWACVVMLSIATIGAFVAVMSGEAAEDVVGASSQAIERAIHEHEESAELARNLFVVTLVSGMALAWAASREIRSAKVVAPLAGVFAIAWAVGAFQLANAGHQGGLLVHLHGIRAPVGVASDASANGAQGEGPRDEQREDDD